MPWFKRDPARKQGTRLSRQLALGLLEDGMGRTEGATPPEAAPLAEAAGRGGEPLSFADQCARVCTRSGRAAHLKHPDLGVLCDEMHDWPEPWQEAPASMPLHRRCEVAALAVDGRRTA